MSHRIRHEADNSVNLVSYRAGDAEAVFERWDFGGATEGFLPIERHALALDRAASVDGKKASCRGRARTGADERG